MPIQPVHQPPYVGKSDQSVCKGQAASMLAEKQMPTPQKQSTHSEAPEQTALWLRRCLAELTDDRHRHAV
jgi:hypothetical protein